ncbi:MAG TPA: hypothetical protein PKE26_06300 [Kiritimatiellia bacterium]|nr:hypothetical protein [Kiritimatiellia bacterium]HMO98704.1 hypothetical protein [Kiritimatiellia bacterium]
MVLAGLLLLGLSSGEIYPMAWLAAKASEDGHLSEPFLQQMQKTQITLAWCLMAGAVFVWIAPDRAHKALLTISHNRFTALAGITAFSLGYLLQQKLFGGIPHVTDAISHLFQARILAMGRWFAPAPECPDSFNQFHILMTHSGMWFTKYTPGHAILLALGLKTQLYPFVVPALSAISTMTLFKLVLRHEGPTSARVFAILFSLSPLGLLLSASFMSHVSAMAMAIVGVYCLENVLNRPAHDPIPAGGSLGAGFFFAFSAMIRPHEFLMIGLIGFLFFCGLSGATWRRFIRMLPYCIAGSLPVLVVWGFWNHTLYGNPLAIGYGFSGDDVIHAPYQGTFGFTEHFGIQEAVSVLVWNLDRVNRSLFGWPVSFLFIPLAFIRRPNRLTWLSVLGASVVMGVYFFYHYRAEYESRYYYLALPFLAYLTVRGIKLFAGIPGPSIRASLALGLIAAFYMHAGLNYWRDYLIPEYGQRYYFAAHDLHNRIRAEIDGRALVTIASPSGNAFVYSSGFIHNDPLLTNRIIYARDLPEAYDCLATAFPDRKHYRYFGEEDGRGILTPLMKNP